MDRKITVQKQQILEVLKPGQHLTADELLQKIRKTEPSFSRATLYRNLAMFCEEGRIEKLSLFDGADRYELASEPHYHVVCTNCGRVENVNINPISTPPSILGFDITDHTLVFYGLCPKCKEKLDK